MLAFKVLELVLLAGILIVHVVPTVTVYVLAFKVLELVLLAGILTVHVVPTLAVLPPKVFSNITQC